MANVKGEVRAREEMIKEKQTFLENEMENNQEQEKKISIAERSAAKLRIDYQEADAARDQFQSEVCITFIFTRTSLKSLRRTVLNNVDM